MSIRMGNVYLENSILNMMNNIYSLERSIKLRKSVLNSDVK
jgi:hypothetical protein